MCDSPEFIVLAESEKARLTRCKICNMYNLIYNNSFIVFSANEFKAFREALTNLKDSEYNKNHPNGESHVLLKNNKTLMGISFSKEDVKHILNLFHESSLYEEVFSILYKS